MAGTSPKWQGNRLLVVDDVISTGSTLQGARQLLAEVGAASSLGSVAILTEGDPEKWAEVIALGNLPVWIVSED